MVRGKKDLGREGVGTVALWGVGQVWGVGQLGEVQLWFPAKFDTRIVAASAAVDCAAVHCAVCSADGNLFSFSFGLQTLTFSETFGPAVRKL